LIRELGRPGIVALDVASGRPSYALLTGLTRDTATLRAAGTEQTVTLTALASRWRGDFATLWRAPPGYTGKLPDAPGATVDWIAARLAAVNGLAPPTGRRVLDESLKAQLRAFQLARGLNADGQVGPMTLMQLNRAAGVEEPRLRTES
jgi:general secretion pathway protein A